MVNDMTEIVNISSTKFASTETHLLECKIKLDNGKEYDVEASRALSYDDNIDPGTPIVDEITITNNGKLKLTDEEEQQLVELIELKL